jgi:hypothetical protein
VPALTFGFGVLLLVLRFFPPSALTLGRLPAAQLAEAFRLAAVALIPGPRQKLPTTARPVTSPRRKPRGARRTPGTRIMLFSSHGRWCSRWGRPRDWLESLGQLSADEPAACGDSGVRDPGRTGSVYPPRLGSAYRGAAFTTSAHSPPRLAPRDQQTVAPAAHRTSREMTKETGKETVLS